MASRSFRREYADLEYEDDERSSHPGALEWAWLILGAAMRRKVLVFAVLLVSFAALVVYYHLRTPLYRVTAKVFVQRNAALPSGVRSTLFDDPTASAWELIHRRDNLLALVDQAKLLEHTPSKFRAPALPSWLDRLFASPEPPATDSARVPGSPEDLREALVFRLERNLKVVAEDGTIEVRLDWPDGQQAYRVVEGALQNFFETRHVLEITAIEEVIGILRTRSARARQEVDRLEQEGPPKEIAAAPPRTPTASQPASPKVRAATEELLLLKTSVDTKERALADLEEFRRRHLAELQAQLEKMQGVYAPNFPDVVNLRQEIESMSAESPQVLKLRNEVRDLRKQYADAAAAEARANPTDAVTPLPAPAPRPVSSNNGSTLTPYQERLNEARAHYREMAERVNAAEIEADAARAAFKYRYKIVWPAEIPREPVSPNPTKIFGAGGIAALLFSILVAAAADLVKGRVAARWQVERTLKLPILAELPRE